MKKIILLNICALMLGACTTLNRSVVSSNLDTQVQNVLKADIKVDMTKKLKGQSSNSVLFGFIEISGPDKFADGVFASDKGLLASIIGGGGESLKAAAAYNALKAGGGDVIVAPQYIIERKSYVIFSTTTVQVTGYPGIIQKIE